MVGLRRDFFYGLAAALVIGAALAVYSMGIRNALTAYFCPGFLIVALIGAVIAEALKFGITGKHLTPIQVFQNILLTGFIASSSSRLGVLQCPSSSSQILMLNATIAALVFLFYNIANARSLARAGRHIKFLTGGLMVGVPYLFGWILLLQNATALKAVGIVFIFNEAAAAMISLATKGKILKTPGTHLILFLVSLGVVAAPAIARLGSGEAVASLPILLQAVVSIITSMLSFAGLWAEVYLITGMALDGGKRTPPSRETIFNHVRIGAKKGLAYSGILMTLLYSLKILLGAGLAQAAASNIPIILGILAGALVFPLAKTIIESFDGSLPFIERARYSYRDASMYARGALAGFGFSYAVVNRLFDKPMPERIIFGLTVGIAASAGVSIFRDVVYALRGRGRVRSWRLYFVDALFGIFIGSGLAFYLDSLQVPVVVKKFALYTSSGFKAVDYITYPLVNKWGRIDLGSYTGGVKLLFTESLAGVINWSIAAWLFAINRVFMQAFFQKDTTPIKFFFSKAGFAELIEHMIYVLRWGLWMSPIIFTFLRMMPDPTWYNQDGAVRSIFAIFNNATMAPGAFREWSLRIFVYIMAFDFLRVLIWMDHMGLRVATLVNLSFIGMDRLDERFARFIGPAAAQRYIPDAVKRFATWAPLLIPFYIPRGAEWDYAWSTSEAMQNAARTRGGEIFTALGAMPLAGKAGVAAGAILACTLASFLMRSLRRRTQRGRIKTREIQNRHYRVTLRENGEIFSEVLPKQLDVSRRSYDTIDPCGRILYFVDTDAEAPEGRFWPVIGNFPQDKFKASRIDRRVERSRGFLKIINESHGIKTTIRITLPDEETPVELWNITCENLTYHRRRLKAVPYLEWVLNGGIHDRFHTQYARLFPEMEYLSGLNAILARQKNTKSFGVLASSLAPEGFLTSRMDFIGRARSVWAPRVLETLGFKPARNTAACPTFDPIGSLALDFTINPKGFKNVTLMIGYAEDRDSAISLVKKHLKLSPLQEPAAKPPTPVAGTPLIGHGERPPGAPSPYATFADGGAKLLVHTPYTPRPFDHAMSNALGHSVMVTNRGLHTSCNGNSQQNRLTPDWADTVTREIPAEALYLYEPATCEWYSPTHEPVRRPGASHECEFGVDGTAVFRMRAGSAGAGGAGELATELTVFVPPDEPTGVYLLTVRNESPRERTLRLAPYFQIALSFQPERAGPLEGICDRASNAVFYENPRNTFRTGPCFAAMSAPVERFETKRGRFFGRARGVVRPYMVERGRPAKGAERADGAAVAAMVATLKLRPGEARTVAVVLGQADTKREARRIIKKYSTVKSARESLEQTRRWWNAFTGTLEVKTDKPEFDNLQNWLKYQALAERIWARRGFYQTSGAFGFRDQLQDTINLMWVDPKLARKQIILHASHQFQEGDVFHWFFTLTDGRTAFACRSHASDNPLWLAWAVGEYVKATSDETILNEMASYVTSQFPFAPLPKNKTGWGHLYHRSTRADTVYRHCLKSIDLVIEKRTGKNGLPLIGTGDWNDGLDEIGSEGKGESVWLAFFLYYILKNMLPIIEKKDGRSRKKHYENKLENLEAAIEKTWREDRYLRAIHDDGTEIGIKGSGIWEIDALTAAWAVFSGINPERAKKGFQTALDVLEKENLVLLGWPALREDMKPYLGRSSKYPEGVRENGMYCHGVQWMIKAARLLGDSDTAYRLWRKITPVSHAIPGEIEIYGGQPNKQAADILTNFDPGRMIWNGYTGAAGWLLRQSMEGVIGASLKDNKLVLPDDLNLPRGPLHIKSVTRK